MAEVVTGDSEACVEAAPVPAHGRYHSLSVTSRAALQE